jgi:hypothetical protein
MANINKEEIILMVIKMVISMLKKVNYNLPKNMLMDNKRIKMIDLFSFFFIDFLTSPILYYSLINCHTITNLTFEYIEILKYNKNNLINI